LKELQQVPRIWSESFKIRSYEVSTTNLASPAALCRYLQEAAGIHASKLNVAGEMLEEQDLMWVLSQLRWQMDSTPAWHDEITIETWPTKRTRGIRAHRDFRIYGATGNQIGQASTMWLLLARKSRRPIRIPNFLDHYQSAGLPDDLLNSRELSVLSETQLSKEYEVRVSDLDANQHVNNVCYVEWALDTLAYEFSRTHRVSDLEISFLGEGKYGDTIVASSQQKSEHPVLEFCHQIANKSDDRALASMRTVWTQL
jgi:medium-chain acyl-[acyl-carrier-protein] hydrolase